MANKDPDRTSLRVAGLLRQVSELELLQAPGLPYNVPRQYAGLPRLTGKQGPGIATGCGGGRLRCRSWPSRCSHLSLPGRTGVGRRRLFNWTASTWLSGHGKHLEYCPLRLDAGWDDYMAQQSKG